MWKDLGREINFIQRHEATAREARVRPRVELALALNGRDLDRPNLYSELRIDSRNKLLF